MRQGDEYPAPVGQRDAGEVPAGRWKRRRTSLPVYGAATPIPLVKHTGVAVRTKDGCGPFRARNDLESALGCPLRAEVVPA
jgi:hypothetical protein